MRCLEIYCSSQADVIVNCAAFSDVDACETQISEAFAVNARGAKMLRLETSRGKGYP